MGLVQVAVVDLVEKLLEVMLKKIEGFLRWSWDLSLIKSSMKIVI